MLLHMKPPWKLVVCLQGLVEGRATFCLLKVYRRDGGLSSSNHSSQGQASSTEEWQRAVVFFVRVDLFAGCLFCDGCLTWVWRRKYWRRMVEDGGLRQKGEGREKEMVMALENRWKHRVLLCYLYMDSSVRFFNWFQLFNLTKPKIEIINNQ